MVTTEKNDILEWLKNQEEFILWNMEGWEVAGDDTLVRESRAELQIVRDLKSIVTESYRWDEEPLNPIDYERRYNELVEMVAQRTAQEKK